MEIDSLRDNVEKFLVSVDTIDIPRGGISTFDFVELICLININAYNTNHNVSNIKIAEIGCWTGKASCALAQIAKDHNGHLTSIDWFKGAEGYDGKTTLSNLDRAGRYCNISQIWKDNIDAQELTNSVTLVEKKSLDAVKDFADNYFDVIFIDGDHRYSWFKKDLDLWYPKVKKGGLICGHDCDILLDGANEFIETLSEVDCATIHFGISKALWEKFTDARKTKDGVIWYKVK
jgi:SAM-dependent methyltransferase